MIVPYEILPDVRRTHMDETIVFRGGCFDLLHIDHVGALKFAKNIGKILVVGVVSDERVVQRKGSERPIQDQEQRLGIVDSLEVVDYSFIMPPMLEDGVQPTHKVIQTLRPDIFVDHEIQADRWALSADFFALNGCETVWDSRTHTTSTTSIIDQIRSLGPAYETAT